LSETLKKLREEERKSGTSKKNPWVAAVLNFLMAGVGFIYLEDEVFVLVGVVLFAEGLVNTFLALAFASILEPLTVLLSLLFGVLWGGVGYISAEFVNERKQSREVKVKLPERKRGKSQS